MLEEIKNQEQAKSRRRMDWFSHWAGVARRVNCARRLQ